MTTHSSLQVQAMKNVSALFSLSQTQRRLAHDYRREALEMERIGNLEEYRYARKESDRLWNAAKWHLRWARQEKDKI